MADREPGLTSDRPPMGQDTEAVYDEQIAPLMSQIIAICKEHRIPMLASFEYSPGNYCSTRIPFDGESSSFAMAFDLIRNGFAAFAVTTRSTGDKP